MAFSVLRNQRKRGESDEFSTKEREKTRLFLLCRRDFTGLISSNLRETGGSSFFVVVVVLAGLVEANARASRATSTVKTIDAHATILLGASGSAAAVVVRRNVGSGSAKTLPHFFTFGLFHVLEATLKALCCVVANLSELSGRGRRTRERRKNRQTNFFQNLRRLSTRAKKRVSTANDVAKRGEKEFQNLLRMLGRLFLVWIDVMSEEESERLDRGIHVVEGFKERNMLRSEVNISEIAKEEISEQFGSVLLVARERLDVKGRFFLFSHEGGGLNSLRRLCGPLRLLHDSFKY